MLKLERVCKLRRRSLNFEGLDTYADIYLNGSLLERTGNMFVGYELPVKEVLREGENRLQVYFHSPIKVGMPQWETDGFDYPAVWLLLPCCNAWREIG